MTTTIRLRLAGTREAADLTAFLGRLLRYDKAAMIRLQAVPGGPVPSEAAGGVLAVFGRLPLGGAGVLAIRTACLARPVEPADVTVSAGQLLDAVDIETGDTPLPPPVTGPAWAGLLPPRSGWRPVAEPAADQVIPQLLTGIREFKEQTATVPGRRHARAELDALADDIWSRPIAVVPELPLRAAHAAYLAGFLAPGTPLSVHRAGGWLRLSTPAGSIALRGAAAPGAGLGLSPLR